MKLVSLRYNRNWHRNLFRHSSKHDVCFGCFTLIYKQRISVFRHNRNTQDHSKQTETKEKWPCPCPCPCPRLCPLHKSVSASVSVCFETPFFVSNCSKTPKQTLNNFCFAKRPKQNPNRSSSVCFGPNRNKKIVSLSISMPKSMSCPCLCSRPCPLHKSALIFSFGLFRNVDFFFRLVSKRFRNTETNRIFVSRNRQKQNRNRSSFGLFLFEPKQKKLFVLSTPVLGRNRLFSLGSFNFSN